jgi:phosphonopyruvate decarboxylase
LIRAASFVEAAARRGTSLWSGVPCSYLQPFINFTIDAPSLRYVGAANEGDAVAIASAAWFAGSIGIAMFQNSGLGNAVNPLTSLNAILRVPVLVITTWRGEPGGAHDEPQHALMGPITPKLLELMEIPWERFPEEEAAVEPALERAFAHMREKRTPYALLMSKGAVAPHALASTPAAVALAAPPPPVAWPSERPSRSAVLEALRDAVDRDGRPTVFVATTGYTGRELYAIGDRPDQVYMVGSMGCAASLGLGLAIARPDQRVVVLDGDGALLMRLGALSALGLERPANLVHVALDNEAHDSTGAQATATHSVDLGAVAAASGIPRVVRATTSAAVAEAALAARELTFVHVKTKPGASKDLPRPAVTPDAVAERLRARLTEESP